MWFKNLQIYRLLKPFALSPEEMHTRLARHPFRPCGPLEMESMGWVPPLGGGAEQLAHAANGCILIGARKQDKLMPASVVNEVVSDKVEAIEDAEGRRVGRAERSRLRDEVIQDLLPRAFSRSRRISAYLDPDAGWLVVDAATPARAEELTELLREALGSLPIAPLAVRIAPAQLMTQWLASTDLPAGLVPTDECELRDPDREGGVVRCRRQDLGADEIQGHRRAGKQVVKLGMAYEDRLTFLLEEGLGIKRLRPTDLLEESRESFESEDELARLDNDFALMSLELGRFIPALVEALGGEDESVYGRAA